MSTPAPLLTGGSLIQSTFGLPNNGPHNLETVVARSISNGLYEIQHYWRLTDSPDEPWSAPVTITDQATGPAAICQRRDYGDGNVIRGNFEVVVPQAGGLVHYTKDNSSITTNSPWIQNPRFAAAFANGPSSILENRVTGDLELVTLWNAFLLHCRYDTGNGWQTVGVISFNAQSGPSLIQSSYDNHLEVIFSEGGNLVLYWYDGAYWRSGGVVAPGTAQPIGFVQGRYGTGPNWNFEVIVPRGDSLDHYWRNNSDGSLAWSFGGVVTSGAGEIVAASLISSGDPQPDGSSDWLLALTQEGNSIYQLHRYNLPGGVRWIRSSCLRLDDDAPFDVDWKNARSWKMAQVTGSVDCQTGGNTLAALGSPGPVLGADAGVTVDHAGRRFLLFGDTAWADGSFSEDSIAEVVDQPPGELPIVTFHGSPRALIGYQSTPPENPYDDVTTGGYDVPLDAFSFENDFYVFFSSNSCSDDNVENSFGLFVNLANKAGNVMGRSILARAVVPSMPIDPCAHHSPIDFQCLTVFSDYHFITVSVQVQAASLVPGFGSEGNLLLIWGTGTYRADDLRLAILDLREEAVYSLLKNGFFPQSFLPVSYFAGFNGTNEPQWSDQESDALPVFWPNALGEISVRWVPEIQRYLLLAMSGPEDRMGAAVWMRIAPYPWGPWSERRQVFDWWQDGAGARPGSSPFIHRNDVQPPDNVGNCIKAIPLQCQDGGGAYAPYLHDVRKTQDALVFRYTLSTWNPYQVMLMEHVVSLADLWALE